MIVRRATPEDAPEIAKVHVRSWQLGYHGILPEAYLGALSVEKREAMWRQTVEKAVTEVWVAVEDDALLGFVSVANSRDSDTDSATGEVWAFYVQPQFWRRGAGRALWTEAEAYFKSAGYTEVTLWVLRDNERALSFYLHLGFMIESGIEKVVEFGGAQCVESRLRLRFGS